MIDYFSNKMQEHFDNNLKDWLVGGPLPGGWTRTGPGLPDIRCKLDSYVRCEVPIEETLKKNRSEIERWHLSFLKEHSDPLNTLYYQQYLHPRYGERAMQKAEQFLELLEDIRANGIHKPVWLADLADLNLGFRYFRFEGCHRICCAKFLGGDKVTAYVFTVREWASSVSPAHLTTLARNLLPRNP